MGSNSEKDGIYGKSSFSIQKEDNSSNNKNWIFWLMSGVTGLIIGGIIAKHWTNGQPEQILEKELQKSFEARRREKRQRVKNLRKDQICVVCLDNEREIILLPCGHFSLCVECSIKIKSICPICRVPIKAKTVVYS